MVIHLDNKDNETEVYHEDNSFNNQGVEPAQSDEMQDEQMQIPNQRKGGAFNNARDFAHGFKEGVKNGLNPTENNPALGINKKDKKNLNNNKNKNQQGNKNSAKGQQDKPKRKNPLPGGGLGDPAKRKRQQDNANNKNNQNQQNKKDKNGDNKNGGLASKLNPMNRRRQMLGGLGGKSAKGGAAKKGASQAGKAMLSGLKTLWMLIPIYIKVAIIGIPVLILLLIAFVSFSSATTAVMVASICSEEGGSTYNGEDYTGSADEKEFLCKMQNPLGSHFDYIVTSRPGPRWGSTHNGIDLAIAKGTPVYAVQAGVVTAVNDGCYDDERSASSSNCGGESRGNYVAILHGGTIETHYYHMVKGSIKVKVGDKVGKGQLIGQVASSGRSTGNHLHFGMKINGTLVFNYVDYFDNYESFKKNCGSMWDGELAGDSANAANDTTDYVYTGSSSSDEECCVTSSTASSSNYCPNGITVTGKNAGTYDLEEYVAGVVSGESWGGQDIEAYKAQAIAARTYAINRTDNCSKSIDNGENAQVFSDDLKEGVEEAVEATNGQVLLYDGNVFSSEYDSFCYNDSDCTYGTEDGKRYVVYRKVPGNETHKVYISSSYYKMVAGGHGRGMSQVAAYEMASQGKTYDEILEFFYADNIEITGATSNQCVLGQASFDGKIWYYDQTDYNQPYGSYGTIATHGCGPTAMAIAVSSILNEKHDPIELTQYACSNGYCSSDGTLHSFFEAAGEKYGLKVKKVSKDNADEVLISLNSGKAIVIAIMGPGTFTSGGHFITLTGSSGDQVFVHDPNNGDDKGFNKLWDFDLIKKEVSSGTNTPFWIISK